MAQKVSVQLVDDIDGSVAESTVEFGLDGVTYAIDLSGENAAALRQSLTPYLEPARRTGGRKLRDNGKRTGTSGKASSSHAEGRRRNQAIREWAREQGLQVSEKGRIPAEIIEQYDNQ